MQSLWRNDFPTSTNPLRFFWFASMPHWPYVVISASAVIIGGSLYSAGIPYAFKLIVDAAEVMKDTGASEGLLLAAGFYIFISLSGHIVWRMSGYAGAHWATRARATARHALTSYVTLHSRAYFSDRFAGSIANKIGHASSGIRSLVENVLWQFLNLLVAVLASFTLAFFISPALSMAFAGWVLFLIFFNLYFARKRIPIAAKAQGLETVITGSTVDLLGNIVTMQEYARREFEMDRLKELIKKRQRAGLRNWYFGEHVLTVNGFIQSAFAALMVFGAVYLAGESIISAGEIVLIITIIFKIEEQFLFVGQQMNEFAERWGEIKESLEEILLPHEMPDRADATQLVVSRGNIAFSNVTFGYADDLVFDRLNLTISAGQRVGVVGRSGAGKSTLVRLLLHHYEIGDGVIAIDDTDIASVTQESLRNAISIVPQEPLLFHRTIKENISYGNLGASDSDIVHAAKLAQADDFIARLPETYQSLVGERGVKLSGGERQRIAIARAILKNAPILLLDEATSALDSESEVAIQKALHNLMEGKTVIAIAHRLSTLREMDRIIVLDRGRVLEDGSHDELLKKGGVYADLWNHQAGGFLQDDE